MPNLIKSNYIEGRPRFEDAENQDAKVKFIKKEGTFQGNNYLINRLKPSKVNNILIRLFHFIIKFFINCFTVVHPNVMREKLVSVIRTGGSFSRDPSLLTVGQLWHHYRRFLNADKKFHSSTNKCFTQLERAENQIQKFQVQRERRRWGSSGHTKTDSSDAYELKIEKQQNQFANQTLKEILQISSEKSTLLTLRRPQKGQSIDESLFLTITKDKKNNYSLRFVGSGPVMGQLADGKVIPLAGKEKVLRELCFDGVTKGELLKDEWLKTLLRDWSQAKDISVEFIKKSTQHIEKKKKASDSISAMTSSSDRVDTLFWRVIDVCIPEKNRLTHVQKKQLKLRANLLSLFDFFQDVRYNLKPHTKQFQTLSQMLEGVSTELLIAKRKGYLSNEEIKANNQELAIIERALQSAKKVPLSVPSKISTKNIVIRANKGAENATQKMTVAEWAEEKWGDRKHGVVPQFAPIEMPSLQSLPLFLYDKIDSKDKFLKIFRKMCKTIAKHSEFGPDQQIAIKDVFRLFSEVPYEFFDKTNCETKKDCFWWKLSKTECIEIMEKINEYTKNFMDRLEPTQIYQYEYEAIMKMTRLVSFLNARESGYWVEKWDSYSYEKHDWLIRTPHLSQPDFSSDQFYSERNIYEKGMSKAFQKKPKGVDLKFIELQHQLIKPINLHNRSNKTTSTWYSQNKFLHWTPLKNWIKPISDPYLRALQHFVITRVAHPMPDQYIEPNHYLKCPEAYQKEPENVFEAFFSQDLEESDSEIEGKKSHSKEILNIMGNIPKNYFSPEEKKRLLHLLRFESNHIELIAFMKECPHLLKNPDVRNFFESLFFCSMDGNRNLKEQDEDYVHSEIAQAIDREAAILREPRTESNPKLFQETTDTVIFYIDLYKKLFLVQKRLNRPIDKFERQGLLTPGSLSGFLTALKEKPVVQESLSHLARTLLHLLLIRTPIDVTFVLVLYSMVKGKTCNPKNIDPYLEQELDRYWQEIVKHCEKDNPNLQCFLDNLCYEKGIVIDGSAWKKEKGVIYRNGLYEVNLKTCEITKIGSKISVKYLPPSIVNDPHFKFIMGEKLDWRTKSQREEGKNIYSFTDVKGREVQIDETSVGHFNIYKKFKLDGKEGKWLQSLPKSTLFTLSKSEIEDEEAIANTQLPYFDHGIFQDPSDLTHLYCIDKNGEISIKIHLSNKKGELRFTKVVDYRSKEPVKYDNITTAFQIKSEALDQIALFENKKKMILFGQNGSLKKVELPRYGLSFSYDGGRLVCDQPAYKDYCIDVSATVKDKKGLIHSLVLVHPDPTKPKKLLIPDTKIIKSILVDAYPEGNRFAKAFYYLKLLTDLFFQSKVPEIQKKLVNEIDCAESTLNYHSLDLRPYTGEICSREKMTHSDILELTAQALMLDLPAFAQEMLNNLEISSKNLDQKLLTQLTKFVQTNFVGTGSEAAIAIKLCLKIKNTLIYQKKFTERLKLSLHQMIMNLGKQYYEYGRKIPREVKLSDDEATLLTAIFKEGDQNYYEQHLKPFFLAEAETFDPLKTDLLNVEDAFKDRLTKTSKNQPPSDICEGIERLESIVRPDHRLSKKSLSYNLPLLEANETIPLINFSAKDKKTLFKTKTVKLPKLSFEITNKHSSCEKEALKEAQINVDKFRDNEEKRPAHILKVDRQILRKFIDAKIVPQQMKWEREVVECRSKIEKMVRFSTNPTDQMAIYAGHKNIASLEELRQALLHDNLQALLDNGKLPLSIKIEDLKKELISLFSALSHRNATVAAIKLADQIIATGKQNDQEEWRILSESLYRLLTMERRYDAHKDPRLLIFEAQQFMNFKPLDGGLDQIMLLDALLMDSQAIVQAPTAAGKTSVLSVMRSLLKANGTNLNIQKVLPPLYQQTLEKLKNVLEDLFGTSIYTLRFNLKMPLSYVEKVNGKDVQHSVFKRMYHEMLETITKKGCVLTDYKSIPLLEQMFFREGRKLVEIKNGPKDALREEHFAYLQKILILIKNKADENMDEFDQPNRPIQKIQLDLGTNFSSISKSLIKICVDIYKKVRKNRTLGLQKNIQGDLSEATRKKEIKKLAKKLADEVHEESNKILDKKKLAKYFNGKSADLLEDLRILKDISPELKDKIAIYKDQISIYLPLTLSYKGGSRYARSEDGKKVIPCYNGERHDAKFGTPLEQINYTIQDYLQFGVTINDVRPWILEQKNLWDNMREGVQKNKILEKFNAILPELSFSQTSEMLDSPEGINALLKQINSNPRKIEFFIEEHLSKLRTSGDIISMDPLNIIDMSRAVSGISATMGAPESLHPDFQVDSEMNGQIKASMLYRLKRRAAKEDIIAYDPAKPCEVLEKTDEHIVHAIIDGAGAFQNTAEAARALKKASKKELQQVRFRDEDGSIGKIGKETADLSKAGYVFLQRETRGTDIELHPKGKAILTLNAKDGIREVFQKEGRLRQPLQKCFYAMPEDQRIENLDQEITHALAQDALIDAQDIYRKAKQQLYAILRAGKREKLLACKTIKDFVDLFENDLYKKSFISQAESNYKKPGSYFEANCEIRKVNVKPFETLITLRDRLVEEARALGLEETVKALESVNYSKELLDKMPERVAPIGAAQGELENELQIEQEEETEVERELEIETQQELEKTHLEKRSMADYPPRLDSDKTHSISDRIHPAYHEKIYVTDNFLPYSRLNTNSQFKRTAFDEQMFRVGQIYFNVTTEITWEGLEMVPKLKEIKSVTIEDPLMSYKNTFKICYDIRTGSFTQIFNGKKYDKINFNETLPLLPEFAEIVSQIKFFDGRIDGYTDGEKEALVEWLRKHKEMKGHFMKQILYHRSEKNHFVGSEMERMFQEAEQEPIGV